MDQHPAKLHSVRIYRLSSPLDSLYTLMITFIKHCNVKLSHDCYHCPGRDSGTGNGEKAMGILKKHFDRSL